MTRHFNRSADREKRRELRNNCTAAEHRLWQYLRTSRTGFRFRRQYSVDVFVLDFFAPRLKLAIEVDGDSHFTEEAIEYDQRRTAFLEAFGIEVLRVTNLDVATNMEGVMDVILAAIRRRATARGLTLPEAASD